MTPVKSIRAKCLDCTCSQPAEVRNCPSSQCPLWPFRFGRNPNRKGIGGKPGGAPRTESLVLRP
jgi:hypothetical protein